MHFFNPVRYMKLLELVVGPDTDPAVVARVRQLRRGRARQGPRLRQGHAELRRQPHRHPRDDDHHPPDDRGRPRARGRRRHHRHRHGAPEERELPDRRYRRPRHLRARRRQLLHRRSSATRTATSSRCPPYIRKMVEAKLLGDKTKGGFYRKAKEGLRDARPGQARVPPPRRRRGDQEGHEVVEKIEDPRRAREEARRRQRQGRAVRLEGALALARVHGAARRRDRRQHRGDR